MRLFLIIALLTFGSIRGYAICAEDNRTLTEVLLNSNATIFSFTVLMSYNEKGSLYSNVVIDKIYFGQTLSQNVVIHTGNLNTSIGAEALKVGEKYLICTEGKANKYYGFGACDRWSRRLMEVDTLQLGIMQRFKILSKKAKVPQWIERDKDGKIMAVGFLAYGKPISSWSFHYPSGILKREVIYDNQSSPMHELLFRKDGSKYSVVSFLQGKPEHSEFYSPEPDNYLQMLIYHTYKGNIKIDNFTHFTKGLQVKESYSQINNYGKNVTPNTANYGQYQRFHENGRLAETGQFHRGMKYGKWFYYNEAGNLIATEILRGPQLY